MNVLMAFFVKDTCLDEYTGAIKQKFPEPLPGAQVVSSISLGTIFKNSVDKSETQ